MKKRLWILAILVTMALLLSSCGEAAITQDQAKEIALAEAGVTAETVQGLTAHLERDDGRKYYEVDFYVDAVEYDVEVDAETGEILKYDREGGAVTTTTAAPTTTTTAATVNTTRVDVDKSNIDVSEEAKELQGLAVGADMDTGTIAHYDRDGDMVPVDDTTFDLDAAKKAKQTALADAGFTAEEVENLTIWIDYDDGKMYYDVEFFKDGTEYEYEIDRETGKIVDKDIDTVTPD